MIFYYISCYGLQVFVQGVNNNQEAPESSIEFFNFLKKILCIFKLVSLEYKNKTAAVSSTVLLAVAITTRYQQFGRNISKFFFKFDTLKYFVLL